ncbi:MAG TPA: hypothetical protein VLV78_18590 [Thermoanaerobaculia bacterium]|nr:hypothetical protein [Thermoanaerobaculia bacterium]
MAAARAHGQFIDQPMELGWYSGLLVFIVPLGWHFLFPKRADGAVTRWWRVGFATLIVGFTVLNITNWCSPGWCGRFGFPFAYSWWSDAIIVINGKNLSAGASIVAAVANLIVLVLAALALSASYRRTGAQAPAPSNSP